MEVCLCVWGFPRQGYPSKVLTHPARDPVNFVLLFLSGAKRGLHCISPSWAYIHSSKLPFGKPRKQKKKKKRFPHFEGLAGMDRGTVSKNPARGTYIRLVTTFFSHSTNLEVRVWATKCQPL